MESKSDLTDFAVSYSRDIRIVGNLRNLVLALESGSLKREDIYTDIVEGTCPCYAETTMAIYNSLEYMPHEDADLFIDYLYRYLKIMLPECVFLEMTPSQSLSGPLHDRVVRQL